MPYSDKSYNLRIELDQKACELSPEQIEKMESALDRLRKLVQRVKAFRARMEHDSELAKQTEGTHQQVTPESDFDQAEIEAAVEQLDYARFRQFTSMFEGSLRRRAGRWL